MISQEAVSGRSPALRPLAPHGLADDVVERIRDAIALGELPEGTALTERDLADTLGVSRGPVREALRRLEDERLVELRLNRGAVVRELSSRDIEEVYGLRFVLERHAIERAAEGRSSDDVDALAAALENLATAAANGTPRDLAVADISFHDCIYRAARHDRLERIWKDLRAQVYVFLHLRNAVSDEYRRRAALDHQELVDLIREGRAADASAAVDAHLSTAYERLLVWQRDRTQERIAA